MGSDWITSDGTKGKETGEPLIHLILPNGRKGEMGDGYMTSGKLPSLSKSLILHV